MYVTVGSLEVKVSTIWIHEKQRWEEPKKKVKEEKRRRRNKEEEEKKQDQRRKQQKKEDQRRTHQKKTGAQKGRKVAKLCVFSENLLLRRVVGSLKRRVRSHLAR